MLKSLEIKNFRLLQDFKVSKLGNVNLIVGKNNAGKSTVLEALQVFASNAHPSVLKEIAIFHNERFAVEEDELNDFFPFEDLFTGRQISNNKHEKIIIGEIDGKEQIKIQRIVLVEETLESASALFGGETQIYTRIKAFLDNEIENLPEQSSIENVLRVNKGKKIFDIRFEEFENNKKTTFQHKPYFSKSLPYSVIPSRFISMDELASQWDKIALQKPANIVMDAMRIIQPSVENITFVEEKRISPKRIAKVKLSDMEYPVPLHSLGDGILKVFQLLLKVFPAKNGFLLIDEFENGLHYSVQEKIWQLLFDLSKELNIQIFATTHSWDCIESFAKVAKEKKDIEGVLFRVGKSVRKSNYGQIIATVFEEDALYQITQSDVEVR